MTNLSLKILCPYHKAEENVGFPDSYDWDNFEGEMWCGAPDEKDKARLLIRLKNRKIQRVVVKEKPGIHFTGDDFAQAMLEARASNEALLAEFRERGEGGTPPPA